MPQKKNIPDEALFRAFMTNSVPYLAERNVWEVLTNEEISQKINELYEKNRDHDVSELLKIASDPRLNITIESKNKSMRLSLESEIKLMILSQRNKLSKTNMIKKILKKDVKSEIESYREDEKTDPSRLAHIDKITKNWLSFETSESQSRYHLDYGFNCDDNLISLFVSNAIVHMRKHFLDNGASIHELNGFFSLFDVSDFWDQVEENVNGYPIFLELSQDNNVYLNINYYISGWPLLEKYEKYEDFISSVPQSIQKVLDGFFEMETAQDDIIEINTLIAYEINLLKLKVTSHDKKIFLNGVDIRDEDFSDKLIEDLCGNIIDDFHSIKKQIVELTRKGMFVEAKDMDFKLNQNKAKRELIEFYLNVIKDLPTQVVSFSTPRNLILLLDSLLEKETFPNRIFSWPDGGI